MPYKTIDEINPALKSLKPPVSLEQANAIAAQADAVGDNDKANGWEVAISAFKKTYTVRKGKWVKREGASKPKEAAEDTAETAEMGMPEYKSTWGATSFEQLDQMRQADDTVEKLNELMGDMNAMLQNITYSAEMDKISAMRQLFDDFLTRAQETMSNPQTEESEPENIEGAIKMIESFCADVSDIVTLEETQPDKPVLMMDVKIIRPGWGNTRDNNYYPAETLKRDASHFINKKMYETDHRTEEKSTRTWVSSIVGIKGFTDDGAPIATVAVVDNNFAEKMRNLKRAGILDQMECSIYGSARGKSGFEKDGRSGKLIEAITDIASVDWVTRAGAGGHVVGLAENEVNMSNAKEPIVTEDAAKTSEVTTVVNNVTIVEQADKSTEEPAIMSEVEVRRVLDNEKLPTQAIKRLAVAQYATEEALKSAIQAERDYIAEIAQSGKVFGMSETHKQPAKTLTMKEREALIDKANAKHLG
jgi:hypothetical protein